MNNRPDLAGSKRVHDTPMSLRVFVALLAGVVAGAPYGISALTGWSPGINRMVLALTLSHAAGAFVVSAIATDRPRWLPGAGFGSVLWAAVVAAILFFGVHNRGGEIAFSPVAAILLLAAAAGAFVGAVGGLLGELAGLVLKRDGDSPPSRLKPWHLGVAVLAIDVIGFEIIALVA
jgi:hypothetical protein